MAKFCGKCGEKVNDNSVFCPKCGTKINGNESNDTGYQDNANSSKNNSLLLKKNRKFFIGIVICVIAVIVAFSFISNISSGIGEKDIKEDLTAYLALDTDSEITDIEIERKNKNEQTGQYTIWCDVVIENEKIKKDQSYILYYTSSDNKEWYLDYAEASNYESWNVSPLIGVTEEEIKNCLFEQPIEIEGNEILLTESNLQDLEIVSQETDLDAKTDTVEITYNMVNDVMTNAISQKLQFKFQDEFWVLYSGEVISYESNYKEGAEFNKSDEEILTDIYSTPIQIEGNYGTQRISLDSLTVSGLSIQSSEFDMATNLQNVKCSFNVTKKVAALSVEAILSYKYNTASGWKISSINYTTEIESISLVGTWQGYYNGSSKPSGTITIDSHDANNMLSGTFAFGPSSTSPDYPTGSNSILGGIDKEDLTIRLKFNQWINEPKSSYRYKDNFNGMLWIDEQKIADGKNFEFILK